MNTTLALIDEVFAVFVVAKSICPRMSILCNALVIVRLKIILIVGIILPNGSEEVCNFPALLGTVASLSCRVWCGRWGFLGGSGIDLGGARIGIVCEWLASI